MRVTAVGADMRRFAVGDAAYERPNRFRIGSIAKRVSQHEDEAVRKPQSPLSFSHMLHIL